MPARCCCATQTIVARLDAARADIAALRAGETGALRVGTYPDRRARPWVMRRFIATGPASSWPSEPATDPELYGLIEPGELDLAACVPHSRTGRSHLELTSDPYVVLVPAENALASRTSVSMDHIGDQPLIGFQHLRSGVVVERELGDRGTHPLRLPLGRQRTVQGLVASGFGVALTRFFAIAPGDDRVKILRLVPKVHAAGGGRVAPDRHPLPVPRVHRDRA